MRTPKNIKAIERKVKRKEPTTFAERNLLKVYIDKNRGNEKRTKPKVS